MLCRVGDGDCGTTIAQGARAIQADCAKSYPLNNAAASMAAVAESVGLSMGGTSGAIYQMFFVALAGQTQCNIPGEVILTGLQSQCLCSSHNVGVLLWCTLTAAIT